MKKLLLVTALVLTFSTLPAQNLQKPRILVYPFKYSGEPANSWTAHGITAGIIDNIKYCSGIRSAENGNIRSAESDREIAATASFMGYTLVFTGDVKSFGGTLTVSARIINSATGDTLFSTGADGNTGNIYDLQEKIFFELTDAASKLKINGTLPVSVSGDETAMIKKRYRPDPESYMYYALAAGRLYSSPVDALEYTRKAVSADPQNPFALIQAGYIAGIIFRLYDEGAGYLDRAEKILASHDGSGTVLHAYILNYRALVCNGRGNYRCAGENVKNGMSVLKNRGLGDSPAYASMLRTEALISSNTGGKERASALYGEAYAVMEKTGLANTLPAALILHDSGTECFRSQKYREALDYFTRSLAIIERISNETRETAAGNSEIGNTYKICGEYDNAFKYYSRSKLIYEKLGLTKNADYAVILNNTGLTHLESGDTDSALKDFIAAEKVESSLGLQDTASYAITMANLGYAWYAKKDYNRAAAFMYRSRSIRSTLGATRDIYYVSLISSLARVEQIRGNNDVSWQLFLEAKKLAEELAFDKKRFYAEVLAGMGLACYNAGEYTMSLYYYEKSGDTLAADGNDGTEIYAEVLLYIARVHAKQGRGDKAAEYFRKSADVYDKAGFDAQSDSVLHEMKGNR